MMLAPLLALLLLVPARAAEPLQEPAAPPAAGDSPSPPPPARIVSVLSQSMAVEVADEEAASRRLVERCEELGGYFEVLTDEMVVLRVPPDALEALDETATSLGTLVFRQLQREDHSLEAASLEARIASRQEMFERYLELLEDASPEGLLSVQEQLASLVQELEALRGELRHLQHQARYARFEVSFQLYQPDLPAPAEDLHSPFHWIEGLGLPPLYARFGNEPRHRREPRLRILGELPQGFAAYPSRRAERAATADGLLLELREFRSRPSADAAFWEEAVSRYLQRSGYALVGRWSLEGELGSGALLAFIVPQQGGDAAYLLGIVPRGRRLRLLQLGGPASAYEARREELLRYLGARKERPLDPLLLE